MQWSAPSQMRQVTTYDGRLRKSQYGNSATAATQVVAAPRPVEHTDAVHDTQFDYYGQLLATASSDRTVGIYSAHLNDADSTPSENRLQRVATLVGHKGPVWMVSWAHPRFGSVLASAGYDKKVIVWKETPPNSLNWVPVHVVDVHQGSVNAVAWGPNEFGPILASASSDGTVAVSIYNNGHWLESVKLSNNSNQIAHAMGATSVSFAPFKAALASQVLLASGGCDCQVRLWTCSVQDDGHLQSFELAQLLEGHTEPVRDVAFCPMSAASRYSLIASCGQDKTVVLYRKPWEQLASELANVAVPEIAPSEWERSVVKFDGPVWRLSWAPSSETLVVTMANAEVFVLREGVDFAEPWQKTPLINDEHSP